MPPRTATPGAEWAVSRARNTGARRPGLEEGCRFICHALGRTSAGPIPPHSGTVTRVLPRRHARVPRPPRTRAAGTARDRARAQRIRSSLSSASTTCMERVMMGALVLLYSSPIRIPPEKTTSSISTPPCVAQWSHSSRSAERIRTASCIAKPSQDAPDFGCPRSAGSVWRCSSAWRSPVTER